MLAVEELQRWQKCLDRIFRGITCGRSIGYSAGLPYCLILQTPDEGEIPIPAEIVGQALDTTPIYSLVLSTSSSEHLAPYLQLSQMNLLSVLWVRCENTFTFPVNLLAENKLNNIKILFITCNKRNAPEKQVLDLRDLLSCPWAPRLSTLLLSDLHLVAPQGVGVKTKGFSLREFTANSCHFEEGCFRLIVECSQKFESVDLEGSDLGIDSWSSLSQVGKSSFLFVRKLNLSRVRVGQLDFSIFPVLEKLELQETNRSILMGLVADDNVLLQLKELDIRGHTLGDQDPLLVQIKARFPFAKL